MQRGSRPVIAAAVEVCGREPFRLNRLQSLSSQHRIDMHVVIAVLAVAAAAVPILPIIVQQHIERLRQALRHRGGQQQLLSLLAVLHGGGAPRLLLLLLLRCPLQHGLPPDTLLLLLLLPAVALLLLLLLLLGGDVKGSERRQHGITNGENFFVGSVLAQQLRISRLQLQPRQQQGR